MIFKPGFSSVKFLTKEYVRAGLFSKILTKADIPMKRHQPPHRWDPKTAIASARVEICIRGVLGKIAPSSSSCPRDEVDLFKLTETGTSQCQQMVNTRQDDNPKSKEGLSGAFVIFEIALLN